MPIEYLPNGKTLLLHYYKKPGKRSGTAIRKTIDSQDSRAVSKAWSELIESVSGGSLKVRFKECVDHAFSDNGGAGMPYDLAKLPRESLVRVGPYAPYIRYQPQKTENVKPKPCVLSIIDETLLERFDDLERRFPDCPYLFPNIRKNKKARIERWEFAGQTHKRFETICKKAEVVDFHFHDLKHVAITEMLRNGFTRDSLKRLGIQFSDRAIDVYDETGAFDELERIRSWRFQGSKPLQAVS